MKTTDVIHIDDLTTGIIAGLAYLGYRSVGVTNFDVDSVEAFNEWVVELNPQPEFMFHLSVSRLHGDCPDFRAAIRDAVYIRDLGFFTDSALGFRVSKDYASRYLESLPGDIEEWISLAKKIAVKHYATSTQILN